MGDPDNPDSKIGQPWDSFRRFSRRLKPDYRVYLVGLQSFAQDCVVCFFLFKEDHRGREAAHPQFAANLNKEGSVSLDRDKGGEECRQPDEGSHCKVPIILATLQKRLRATHARQQPLLLELAIGAGRGRESDMKGSRYFAE